MIIYIIYLVPVGDVEIALIEVDRVNYENMICIITGSAVATALC